MRHMCISTDVHQFIYYTYTFGMEAAETHYFPLHFKHFKNQLWENKFWVFSLKGMELEASYLCIAWNICPKTDHYALGGSWITNQKASKATGQKNVLGRIFRYIFSVATSIEVCLYCLFFVLIQAESCQDRTWNHEFDACFKKRRVVWTSCCSFHPQNSPTPQFSILCDRVIF